MLRPYERAVYYYETDKMGIMHHSNYIRIFEETRVHFLGEAGMPFTEIEAQGILMPVLSVECSYLRPLRFGDSFSVSFRITGFNGVKLFVEYTVTNKATGEVCAVGKSSHCFTDTELRPVRTKAKYPAIYSIFADNMD
ncbi:MAG: acyl-CoA thioesterase [Ruminococcus sp.]|nr:acyl-CoA thioesterase [Ruminococcus sp.]